MMQRFFSLTELRGISSITVAAALMIIGVTMAPTASAQQDEPGNTLQSAADLGRGRALYGASCDACHSQNIHWRDKGVVSSWATLVGEVTRWQRNAGQSWGQSEINDVAAYLNDRFYRLPCPREVCTEKQAAVRPITPR